MYAPQTHHALTLDVGVKTDPIETRYTHDWLFRLLAEEDIRYVQLGTFFEMYQLPDEFFLRLRDQAEAKGISISSVFTSHRELGGFFFPNSDWEQVARRNYERLIEIGALVGARNVGSNPGAVPRDRMDYKPDGLACYLRNMKGLLEYAYLHGVETLTIEPMSCLAEPPTLTSEIIDLAADLAALRTSDGHPRAQFGYCFDVSHGYINAGGEVVSDPYALFDAALPSVRELHLRNTDAVFERTFGFTESERAAGIVDVREVRDYLLKNAEGLPETHLIGYLEIPGPKVGRDYSDARLEDTLRESLRYIRENFQIAGETPARDLHLFRPTETITSHAVKVAPSIMCADLSWLAKSVRSLQACGVDMLHIDIMDAHFAPNMPLGIATIEQLRSQTDLPFDVHLMVTDNDFFVERMAAIGVQSVAVHYESCTHLDRTLASLRGAGIRAGIAINPTTPLSVLNYVLERIDYVLLMTVNPGYAGQQLVPSALRKIKDCRDLLDRAAPHVQISVDGNVSFENIPGMVAAGADILVAGSSSLFSPSGALKANMARMGDAVNLGLAERLVDKKGVAA